MTERTAQRMREYWEERAKLNAAWYVDTSLDYDHPDMAAFMATGEKVVAEAIGDDAPARPAGTARAVEIGCGIGRICKALRGRFDEVVGLDISAGMIERARELVTEPGVRFEVGDGSTLQPLETASTDLVLTFTVFQHIPDRDLVAGYIREAARVLRPGGVLVAQWNGIEHARMWALRRRARQLAGRLHLARLDARGRDQPEFLGCRIPADQMRQILESSGFRVAGFRGTGTLFSWVWAVRG